MIHQSLQFTNKLLGQFLKNRFALTEDKTVVNYLIEPSGTLPKANQNKVVLSLINIEKETNQPFYIRNQKLESGNYSNFNPTERYNIDLLISSNFDDYSESLKFLDAIIVFFQINNYIDASSSSSIPDGLSRLEFEYEKISYHQMHSLWTAMAAKYQPSIIYKMKLIKVQSHEIMEIIPSVKNTNNTISK
ncbi:MAG: Pvc16 family protein [Flavobacterium sp.]|uniref:Pvc16 family protein n=1 Tax=Flavobacterium sp. TaxID=239 RepID=UPI003D0F2AB3